MCLEGRQQRVVAIGRDIPHLSIQRECNWQMVRAKNTMFFVLVKHVQWQKPFQLSHLKLITPVKLLKVSSVAALPCGINDDLAPEQHNVAKLLHLR